MVKYNRGKEDKDNQKTKKINNISSFEQIYQQADRFDFQDESNLAVQGNITQAHAARLNDQQLPKAQRRSLATKIGRLQGNQRLQRVVGGSNTKVGHPEDNPFIQRDLLNLQRNESNIIEIRTSFPTNYGNLENDVSEGLSRFVSGARLSRFIGSIRQNLTYYYGLLEGAVQDLSTLTLEIGINTTTVTANLIRATDPGNPAELMPIGGRGTSGSTTEEEVSQAETPSSTDTTAESPGRTEEAESQAETPSRTPPTTSTTEPERGTDELESQIEPSEQVRPAEPARPSEGLESQIEERPSASATMEPARPSQEEVSQAETPSPTGTTAESPGRTEEEESQAETPSRTLTPTPTTESSQIHTIRTPYSVSETPLPSISAGPVLIFPTYKLGGNLDVSSTGPTTSREFRTNLRTRIPEIQQTLQDEYRQLGIEYTAEGPAVSFRDRRINMEMQVKAGNIIEFKSQAFQIQRNFGNIRVQVNLDVTLSLRITGNPAVIEAILIAAAATASVAAFIHTLSQISAGIASAVEVFFAGLASVGSRIIIPVVLIPREAIEEILQESEPGGGRSGMTA